MKARILNDTKQKKKILIDQNGFKYIEVKQHYDVATNNNGFAFRCNKNESQNCMAKVTYNETTKKATLITSHSCRWTYEEIPDYRKDNSYIHTGYHPSINTWRETFGLLVTLHSETVNIWSHMVGIFLFSWYLWDSVFNVDAFDYWIKVWFDLAALIFFINSTAYHWLHICSENCHNYVLCLDHCGIALHVYNLHLTWMYRGLIYNEQLFSVFFVIQTVILFLTVIVSYRNIYLYVWGSYDWKFNESLRCGLYVLPHLFVYLIMYYYQYHLDEESHFITLECWDSLFLCSITTYISGIVYVLKYPEVVWPGKFDIFFNSHQIMHFMLLLGIVSERYFLDCIRITK